MPDRSRLPPLNALRALEALERLGTAQAVADELSLTRSAISHMLRRFEQEAGFALTEPDGRGLKLTARGRHYALEARRALAILKDAASRERPPVTGELAVVCPPGFAALWLADRIGGFAALYPDVRLKLSASRVLGDMGDEAGDVQVAFSDDAAMRGKAELLARVSLFPVCAPSALSAEPGLRKASDLARFRLLHLVTEVDWQRWLEAAGAAGVNAQSGLMFSDMPMVQLAAAAGQGVALGDSLTARAALDAGHLVRPFALSIPSRWNYYMRVAGSGPRAHVAQAFAGWMRGQLVDVSGAA
jgi:LysR family glycine cleavage system transcriptional activator